MAITSGQRDDILKVVIGLFGGAPGNVYLPELATVVESGVSREGLADLLADTAIFKTGIIGGNVTVEEQADILLSHLVWWMMALKAVPVPKPKLTLWAS